MNPDDDEPDMVDHTIPFAPDEITELGGGRVLLGWDIGDQVVELMCYEQHFTSFPDGSTFLVPVLTARPTGPSPHELTMIDFLDADL